MSHRKWMPQFGHRRGPRQPPADPFGTRTARDLAGVLVDLDILDEGQDVRVRRVYAGSHQRAAGAWSWWAEDRRGHEVCGSQFKAREIITAHRSPGRCVSVSTSGGGVSLFPETGEMCPHDNLIRPGYDGACGCRVIDAAP